MSCLIATSWPEPGHKKQAVQSVPHVKALCVQAWGLVCIPWLLVAGWKLCGSLGSCVYFYVNMCACVWLYVKASGQPWVSLLRCQPLFMKVSYWSEFAKKSRLAAQRDQPVSASPEIPKDSSVSTSQCWDSKHATPQFLALIPKHLSSPCTCILCKGAMSIKQEWTVTLGNVWVAFVPMSWHVIPCSPQGVKMMSFWWIISWLVLAITYSPERSR